MALKSTSWKAPTVETLSTSLTYIALTGALLAPLATASPRLPPAVEAKALTSALPVATAIVPNADRTLAQPVATDLQDRSAIQSEKAQSEQELTATDQPSRELSAVPPTQVAEARTRLKSVKAKEDRQERKEEPDKGEKTKREKAAAPVDETADVHVTETDASAKADKAGAKSNGKALPPPTATVPVASSEPVNPADPAVAWNEADVASALKECLRLLAPVAAEIEVNTAMRKGQCGTPAPILLKSVGTNPRVTFQPAVEINCQMAVALGEWATDTMQPAARDAYGSEVKSIVGASGYSCRNRYGLANERLSEHALANAIDIGGFALANGRSVKVSSGWGATQRDRVAADKAKENPVDLPAAKGPDKSDDKATATPVIKGEKSAQRASLKAADLKKSEKDTGKDKPDVVTAAKVAEVDGKSTPDGKFLRRLHEGACGPFGTVLGPEANEAHRDHLHLDLKARKHRAVCQ